MRLTLLRHAEAAAGAGSGDLDRPLTLAGHDAARALGARLRREGFTAPRIWSSPAVRATDTIAALAIGLGQPLRPRIRRDVYLASTEELAELLAAETEAGDLMIVGHNPGLQALGRLLAGTGDPLSLRIDREELVPCGLIELEVADPRRIAPGTARALRFLPAGPA